MFVTSRTGAGATGTCSQYAHACVVPEAMNDCTLHNFDEADVDELLPMWRESFEFGVGILDPHPLAEQRAYFLSEVLSKHTVKVAVLDGRLVGFVAASSGSIAQLYVKVGSFRQGIGSQLLEWAKAQSEGSLWLFTFARNQRARRFYEHHGFRAVAFGFEPTWRLDDVRYQWHHSCQELVPQPLHP